MRGASSFSVLSKLISIGALKRESYFSESRSVTVETAELDGEGLFMAEDDLVNLTRGEKQKAALRVLSLCGSMTLRELRDRYEIPRSVIKSLSDKGLVRIKSEDAYRDPYRGRISYDPPKVTLSEQQERAKNEIMSLFRLGEAKAALLFGVTRKR